MYLDFSKKIIRIPRLSSDIKRAQTVTVSDNFQKGYPSKASTCITIPARSAGASHPTLMLYFLGKLHRGPETAIKNSFFVIGFLKQNYTFPARSIVRSETS